MRSENKLWEICMEIYRLLFKEAKPSADFDKLMKKGITKKPEWFMRYYLPIERQVEIIDKVTKKHKCIPYEIKKISVTIHLGCSPNSSLESWKKLKDGIHR